jgi:hypothetical protein
MSEILADLDTTIVSPEGDEYYVQVVGEHLLTGMWEAWLEFVPLDDALEVLRTTTETTQTTREDVVRWSETLTQVYLQGAFARAVDISDGGSVVRNYATVIADVAVPFDPFEVLPLGKPALRARLRVLTRSELLAIIQSFDLNPAGKSLTRLSDSQLVTFIVTAVGRFRVVTDQTSAGGVITMRQRCSLISTAAMRHHREFRELVCSRDQVLDLM